MPTRVFISTSSFATTGRRPLELLEAAGYEVTLNSLGRKLKPAETVELLQGIDGLIAGTEVLNRELLEQAPDLKVISRCGVGTDNVDLQAAEELGIKVRFVPGAHVDAVAELTLAGILSLLRSIGSADRNLRQGIWRKPMGGLLRGRTVGVIGLGRVGRRFVELLAPFSCPVLAHDPIQDPEWARKNGVSYVNFEQLLAESDVVCLLASQAPGDRSLIEASQLALMKSGSLLVNTSRGGLVDESATATALESGHLSGAYFDVFESEPYEGPLASFENALLTPHIGSYAKESRLRMETEAVENLIDSMRGQNR